MVEGEQPALLNPDEFSPSPTAVWLNVPNDRFHGQRDLHLAVR